MNEQDKRILRMVIRRFEKDATTYRIIIDDAARRLRKCVQSIDDLTAMVVADNA